MLIGNLETNSWYDLPLFSCGSYSRHWRNPLNYYYITIFLNWHGLCNVVGIFAEQFVKQPIEPKRNFKMTNTNIQSQIAAAFAAILTAAVFVSASVGPAVNNAAAMIA